MAKKQKLSLWQYFVAITKVGRESFKIAPSAGIVRIIDSVIQASLPIATTYFAALTTTALTNAYAGQDGAGDDALLYVFVTAGLGLVTLAWNSVSGFITQKTRYVIETTVEDRMTVQFTSLPFALYDDKEVIDLHEKAKRFSYFFNYIFETIGGMITSLVGAVGSLIALSFISPWLALAVLVAILPGIVIQIGLARKQAEHWEGNITNRRRMYNIGGVINSPRNIAELRVYGVVKHLIQVRAKLRDQDEKERLQLELRTVWLRLAADIGESIVELGALVWVVFQIIDRSQPVGQFLYVQQMVGRAIGQTGSLASQLGRIDQDLANIVDYQNFMELEAVEDGQIRLEREPSTITLDSVSFAYPKTEKQVLRDVSISISKGQRIAIVGENGAGKSTLVKLILGLYHPTKGEIRVDDVPLHKVDASSWHEYIALLGQDFVNYYFATIRENITLGRTGKRPTDEAVHQAIAAAQFDGVVKGLKHGLDTYTERWMAEDNDEASATELSGGQYQRLALARNFYRDSPIVILDEPTSAIDALAEANIFKHLFTQSDKTIITISHRLTTVEKADRIYMLKDGQIVEQGTSKELIERRGEFYTMFESQI